MNITRKDIDSLNAVLTVQISEDDYAGAVEKILKDYRKTANVPGFRKGHVPMGMIKKQYGQSVMLDEVNKLVQKSLNDYLTEEKIELLGQPLPVNQESVDWSAKDFSFDFELGLAPKFEVNLDNLDVTHFQIVVSDEMAEKQVEHIRKQYGKLIAKDEVSEGDELTGSFESDQADIDHETTFSLEELKRKGDISKLVGKKVGDSVVLKTKNLFVDGKQATISHLGVSADIAETLDTEVTFVIDEINTRELAKLNQDLFDKIFGEGEVTSEEELIAKIKEDGKKQFEQQSDQKLLDDIVESLLENTKIDLPEEFLQRWIKETAEEEMTEEEAAEEFKRSEKGLRYQLVEGHLTKEHKLSPDFEEIKEFAGEMVKMQMAQFGQTNPSKEDLDPIVMRILSNQEELERIHQQLVTKKLLDFFKENAKLKTKEVDFEEFVKEAYETK
ncbi:MAG TPA: trigger factor [Flavobacteriaceae bacterium]|nr:trigger factor [Flavobacteriaceae bacterium]